MKKKICLIIVLILFLIVISFVGFYAYAMSPIGKEKEEITFVIKPGESKIQVTENLEEANLIRNAFALKIYLFFRSDLNIQAGIYTFTKSDSPKEIIAKMHRGDIRNNTIKITLVEGRRLTEYAKLLSEKLKFTQEEFLAKINNQEYLQELIQKYWFLEDDILNQQLYYPLEGYLFPDTYEFSENSTIEEVVQKILDHTNIKLNTIKEQIINSNYNIHEILSMASIIELEAVNESDRHTVSQVIYKRLDSGMGLGMDVTTYYAVKKEMGAGLTLTDLKTVNPYNTSEMNTSMAGKLPVGPICNPSIQSITSALEPSNTSYLYFYADIKTGKVYFSNTFEEHQKVIKEVG